MIEGPLEVSAAMAGPFPRSYTVSSKPDLPQQRDEQLDNLLHQYLEKLHSFPNRPNALHLRNSNISLNNTNLNTTEIQKFLRATQVFEDIPHYCDVTGTFTTILIQHAHNNGQNNFEIDCREIKPLNFLCYELKERTKGSLEIILRGNSGTYCGLFSVGGRYFIEQAGDYLFKHSMGGTYYINHAGEYCAMDSEHATYYITEAGSSCASFAKNTNFYFTEIGSRQYYKNIPGTYAFKSKNCHFHTANEKIYKILKRQFRGRSTRTASMLSPEEWEHHWAPAHERLKR